MMMCPWVGAAGCPLVGVEWVYCSAPLGRGRLLVEVEEGGEGRLMLLTRGLGREKERESCVVWE